MQDRNYASIWVRALAKILDSAIVSLDVFVILFMFSAFWSKSLYDFFPSLLWILLYLLFIRWVVVFFIQPYLISKFGGNVGKILTGLEIVHEDDKYLTFKRAIFREYVARIASSVMFGVGYYWIIKDKRKQAWHDMLSDTFVVKKSNSGLLIGLIALVPLLIVELVLLTGTVFNFVNNKTLGSDIGDVYRSILESTTKNKLKEIPVPYDIPTTPSYSPDLGPVDVTQP